MSRALIGLFFLPYAYTNGQGGSLPEIRSEIVPLVEISSDPGTHQYTLTLPDRLRTRHFHFEVDRSACKGDLLVNNQKLASDDADEIFAFDRANRIRLEGCLERTPAPLKLTAHPKVHIAQAEATFHSAAQELRLEIRLRNTQDNSATVVLESPEFPTWEASFFLGPQTSQTQRLVLRLVRYRETITLKLTKYEEALEPPYRHIQELRIPR
ncbi:MAG: hypothetical protein NW208_12535 [Bryobacter sp.]|nr:hypothetical protein [Bryobacter sp.]